MRSARSVAFPTLAAFSGAMAAAATSALGADANLQVIMRANTPAPGIAGATLDRIASRGMGPGGHAIIVATLRGATISTTNDDALYRDRDGQSRLLWRESDPLPPGFPVGARFSSGPLAIQMDGAGRAYFSPSLFGAGTGARACFRADGTTMTELVRIGQIAPGAIGTIANFQSGFLVSPEGDFVLQAQLALGGGVTSSNDMFLYRWRDSGASVLAREAQPLGSTGFGLVLPNTLSWDVTSAPIGPGSFLIGSGANSNTLVYGVFGPPPLDFMGTFYGPGANQLTAPNAITFARTIAASPRGDLFAVVQTDGNIDSLIVQRPGFSARRLFREGESIGGVVITDINVVGTPIVAGPNGDCVVMGRAGPNDTLIHFDNTGFATILARIGQPLVGPDTVALFENTLSPPAGLDAGGRAAFNATTRSAAGITRRGVYVFTPGAGVRSVLRTDDTLPGTSDVVLNAGLVTSVDNPVTGGLAVSPDGRFVVSARIAIGNVFDTLVLARTATCNSIDFNRDGVFPDITDVITFFDVFGGGNCPACDPIDFNNDGVFPDLQDVIKFLDVFGGGAC